MINLIVAIAPGNVIGNNNELPWYLPEDLKRFKEITTGHTVVMGRKTYDSIINRIGKPLPNRKSVVITRQDNFSANEGVLVFHSLEDALEALKDEDLYILGGAEIYKQALPRVQRAFVTHVKENHTGDVHFPEVDWSTWNRVNFEPHEQFDFATYERK